MTIYTREELKHKIEEIINYYYGRYDNESEEISNDICDLIATLNDEEEDVLKGTRHKSEVKYLWKNIP